MNILAFDTSGQSFSAALVSEGVLICEETFSVKETHARHIMPVLEGMLLSSGKNMDDLGKIAVTIGPGSFTGLRIGLGVAKGIAFALGISISGVSTLDALAWPFRDSAFPVQILVDARRGEVYSARYLFKNGKIFSKTDEMVCSPEDAVKGAEENVLFCASGASVYLKRIESFLGFRINPLNTDSFIKASDVAILASLQENSGYADVSEIGPFYLRRSEAEINYEMRNRPI